jgi:hypothetical protein
MILKSLFFPALPPVNPLDSQWTGWHQHTRIRQCGGGQRLKAVSNPANG